MAKVATGTLLLKHDNVQGKEMISMFRGVVIIIFKAHLQHCVKK